jgi:DNA-binding MarR family transcriptional regulator
VVTSKRTSSSHGRGTHDKQENLTVFLFICIHGGMKDTIAPAGPENAADDLALAIGQIVRRLRTEVNPGELTLSQSSALGRLGRAGWLTTADLARIESVKPQSMSATLASLEQEGLVERQADPVDGRQVLFGLTPSGVEARRQRGIAKRKWLLSAIAKLSLDEQQTLFAAIDLIKRLGDS